ncbi:MAG: hypothetical protein QXI60_10010 [Thermofilaceae archaeon]
MSLEQELPHHTRETKVELGYTDSLNVLAFYELFVRGIKKMLFKLAERLSSYAIRYVFGFDAIVPDMYDRHSEYLTLTAYRSPYDDSYVTLQVDPNNLRGTAMSTKAGAEEIKGIVERLGTVAVSVALSLLNTLSDNPVCYKSLDCQNYLSRVDYVLDLFKRHGRYPPADEEVIEHVVRVVSDLAIPVQHECVTDTVGTLLYHTVYPESVPTLTVDLGNVRATVLFTEHWLKAQFRRGEDMENTVTVEAFAKAYNTLYVNVVPRSIGEESYALAAEVSGNWKQYVARALDAYVEQLAKLDIDNHTKKSVANLARAWKKLVEDCKVKKTIVI